MNNYYLLLTVFAIAFAFYFCYLFITQRNRGQILKHNLNVKKVTISPGGIPMIWISENDFFVDVAVDRTRSWRELISVISPNFTASNLEKDIVFKSMPYFSIENVRLYFVQTDNRIGENDLNFLLKKHKLTPDPVALLTLYTIDKSFMRTDCFWEYKEDAIARLTIDVKNIETKIMTNRKNNFSGHLISGQKV